MQKISQVIASPIIFGGRNAVGILISFLLHGESLICIFTPYLFRQGNDVMEEEDASPTQEDGNTEYSIASYPMLVLFHI